MFALRYFANRLFPNRFFPHVGANPAPASTGILIFDPNSLHIQFVAVPVGLNYDKSELELHYIDTALKVESITQPIPVQYVRDKT